MILRWYSDILSMSYKMTRPTRPSTYIGCNNITTFFFEPLPNKCRKFQHFLTLPPLNCGKWKISGNFAKKKHSFSRTFGKVWSWPKPPLVENFRTFQLQ